MTDGDGPSYFSSSSLSLHRGKQNTFDLKKREILGLGLFGFGVFLQTCVSEWDHASRIRSASFVLVQCLVLLSCSEQWEITATGVF